MITSAETIRSIIRGELPDVQFIWMQDGNYIRPKMEEVVAAAIKSGVNHLRFNGELMDCDDYALLLNASIKRTRIDLGDSLSADGSYHWSFGEAFGIKFNGLEEDHTLCVCVAEEGVFLLEPQTYDYWSPRPGKDSVLIIKM